MHKHTPKNQFKTRNPPLCQNTSHYISIFNFNPCPIFHAFHLSSPGWFAIFLSHPQSAILFIHLDLPFLPVLVALATHDHAAKGARRQVQGGALASPGFWFSGFCRTLSMHSVWHRDTISLFSTQWNTTAGVGVPQVNTRQICLSTFTSLWVCTPLKKFLRAPMHAAALRVLHLPLFLSSSVQSGRSKVLRRDYLAANTTVVTRWGVVLPVRPAAISLHWWPGRRQTLGFQHPATFA